MKVLNLFSIDRCEIGLSELARMSGIDKAATLRLLVALKKYNYIEQNNVTRKYRLGGGFLRLAHIREITQPIGKVGKEITDWLTAESGETAHISVPGSDMLTTISHSEPIRGTIVHLDPGELLPLNATASGIAFLGFLTKAERNVHLARSAQTYTSKTIVDPLEINRLAEQALINGFATSNSGFEDDVYGIAVPFFGQKGEVEGTIAIAAPSSRMNEQKCETIKALLFEASMRLTTAFGGISHANMPALTEIEEA